MEWRKLNFPFELKVTLTPNLFLTPKTQNGMEEAQLPFELQSDTHTSFTPRKLKMEWRKLNFPFELKVRLTHLKLKMEWRNLNFPSNSK